MDLPVDGAPVQSIEAAHPIRTVAVLGNDYHGMKPTMAVQVGDRVKRGQILFSDKKNPGVHVTSPAAGTVAAIHRGAQRVLQSVVIQGRAMKKKPSPLTPTISLRHLTPR